MNRQATEVLRQLRAPRADELGHTPEDWLMHLAGPVLLEIPGADRSRCRAFATLLHGNEPSGFRALHRWLKERWLAAGETPAVDLLVLVGAVEAALKPPGFAYRHLPGVRDLNRCFRPPFDDAPGQLAAAFLEVLHARAPEALVDMHNTSGAGPGFAVSIREDARHDALTRLFTRRLVLTDLRLGALMEYAERDVPTITVECGGALDPAADRLAFDGLCRYLAAADLFSDALSGQDVAPLARFHQPSRLELVEGAVIGYGEGHRPQDDLTLPFAVEALNFQTVRAGQLIGWLGERGLDALCLRNAGRALRLADCFANRDGELVAKQDLVLFMVTTDPAIARSDCIGYFTLCRYGASK